MGLIRCPDCGKEISDAAPTCPHCGRPNPRGDTPAVQAKDKQNGCALGCLALFVVALLLGMCGKDAAHRSRAARGVDDTSSPLGVSASAAPLLELQNYTWSEEYGYAILEGSVKNISGAPLRNVLAVGNFYDASGELITSDDALIEYNPILPGQTSPFKVMARYNPAMKKAGIDFKELLGGTIEWRQRERSSTKK